MKARFAAFLLGTAAGLVALELGLAALAAAYVRLYAPRAPAGDGPAAILCIGDSFTIGIGAPPGRSYPDQLQELLAAGGRTDRVVNAGRAVANTAMARTVFDEQVGLLQPRLVVLMIGPANYWNLTGYRRPGRRDFTEAARAVWQSFRIPKLVILLRHQWERPVQPGFLSSGHAPGQAPALPQKGVRPGSLEAMLRAGVPVENVLRAGRLRLKASPRDPRIPLAMGRALLIAGRIPEAENLFRQAAALTPNDPSLAFDIAWSYLRAHPLRPEARAWAARGMRLAPDAPDFTLLMFYLEKQAADSAAAQARNWVEEVEEHRRLGRRLRYWRALAEGFSDAALEGAIRYGDSLSSHSADPDAWIRADIVWIARECRRRGISLILMNYPNPTRFKGYREVAAQEKIDLIDNEAAFDLLRLQDGAAAYFSPDGHCNAAGYGVIARALADRILSLPSRTKGGAAGRQRGVRTPS